MSAKDAVKAREDAKRSVRVTVQITAADVETKKPRRVKTEPVETPEGLDALEYEVPLGDS